MSKPFRSASAASFIALTSMIAGCAAPQAKVAGASHFGGRANVELGLATRALAALNSNDVPQAISLAERAVAQTPNDAGFRALLGNAYFAGGRFWSAEQAYKDSLTIYSNQPQVVLKLALVEIALGKKNEAVMFLDAGREVLNASDYGLALALAGRPAEAVAVLGVVARDRNADATVRQNLALAYALSGDWANARTVASQDVAASKLDSRIQQWMQLANPAHPADQVAALVGVTPAAVDHGQPVRLALNHTDTRQAQAAPAAAAPQPQVAQAAVPAPQPQYVAAIAPAPAPVAISAVAPAPPPANPRRKPAIAAASPAPMTLAMIAAASPEAPSAFAAAMANAPVRAAAQPKPRRAAAPAPRPQVRHGNSTAVVQLGAYGSPNRVLAAWNGTARKYSVLKAYLPVSARFASPKGVFYRLSVKGFASAGEANALCANVRRKGGNCFVRNFAGDAPVQLAMR
ncbi:MAG: SPOR domain-containing protein [Pseudomonadota bacterium]